MNYILLPGRVRTVYIALCTASCQARRVREVVQSDWQSILSLAAKEEVFGWAGCG